MSERPDEPTDVPTSIRSSGSDRLSALEHAFTTARPKLARMVRHRLDARVATRIDIEDVLQEAWLTIARRAADFDPTDDLAATFAWLRTLTFQTVIDVHRRHLGAGKRDLARERRPQPRAANRSDSASMSALWQVAASLTSPSGAAMRAESHAGLRAAIESMPDVDREILVLRHFEELSNDEVAAVLELPRSTASYRYVRAIAELRRRLTATLDDSQDRRGPRA